MAESKGKILAIGVVFTIFPLPFLGARLLARKKSGMKIGLDDLFMGLSFVFFILGCAGYFYAASPGILGQHETEYDSNGLPVWDHRIVAYLQGTFFLTAAGMPTLGFAKLSVLFFYRRIFVGHRFNIASWTGITVVSIYMVAFTIGALAQCIPISLNWASYEVRATTTKCINEEYLLAAYGIIDIITDFMILIIPMFMISKLHMPLRRKLMVSGIFAMGFLVVIISAIRLGMFKLMEDENAKSNDFPYIWAKSAYWALLVSSFALVAACLPTLGPLVTDVSLKRMLNSLRYHISLQSLRRTKSSPSPTIGTAGQFETADAHRLDSRSDVELRGWDDSHLAEQGQHSELMPNEKLTNGGVKPVVRIREHI